MHKPRQEMFLLLCTVQVASSVSPGYNDKPWQPLGAGNPWPFCNPWKKPAGSLLWDDCRTRGVRIISHQVKEVKSTFQIQLVSTGIQLPFRHSRQWKLHQKLALQPGQGADKGDIFNLECSNKGMRIPLPIWKSLHHLWRNTMREIQKSTDCTLELLFAFSAWEKKPAREEIEPRLPEWGCQGLSHKALEWCNLKMRRTHWGEPNPAKVFHKRPVLLWWNHSSHFGLVWSFGGILCDNLALFPSPWQSRDWRKWWGFYSSLW